MYKAIGDFEVLKCQKFLLFPTAAKATNLLEHGGFLFLGGEDKEYSHLPRVNPHEKLCFRGAL